MSLPSILSSTLETRLRINAISRDIEGTPVEISYLPPMYVPMREVIFISSIAQEIPTAILDIYGLSHVLEHVIVSIFKIDFYRSNFYTKIVLQCFNSIEFNLD